MLVKHPCGGHGVQRLRRTTACRRGSTRRYDPPVDGRSEQREWSERVREQRAADVEADRAAVALMTVSERLELGLELSRFAVRMRNAFREQSAAR